jgi:6-pyruvoyltetrahydropterin/6-carboxytetrahydropterin synthase
VQVTRKAEFSASHFCRVRSLNESENYRLFGEEANPNGHGHNYIVEVTVEGDPDPITGMVIDLKYLKDVLERHVIEPMDHRFLNYEVPPFEEVVPSTANVALEIWRRIEPQVSTPSTRLSRVRLFETADLYVDVDREDLAA